LKSARRLFTGSVESVLCTNQAMTMNSKS
jgi:hypothetical protein